MTAMCPSCSGPLKRLRLPLERARLAVCESCGHGVTVAAPRLLSHDAYGGPGARAAYEREYLAARVAAWNRGLDALG